MLKGQSINLRTIRRSDLQTYLDLSSDIESRGDFFPLTLQTEPTLQARYEKDGMWSTDNGTLLIVDALTDRILGSISHFKGVHYYDGVEVGYIIYNPSDRGKGVTTDALRMYVKYLFDLLPCERIQLQTEPGNGASSRVAQKCGFQLEGVARSAFIHRGKHSDIQVFSILRSEFFAE